MWFIPLEHGFEGRGAILNERLIRILTRKSKKQLKDQTSAIDKLRKQERLTDDEFWKVYETIHKVGPEMNYRNPDKWVGNYD
jgi:hypothetical protein